MTRWNAFPSLILLSYSALVTSRQWACYPPDGGAPTSNDIYQPCIRIDGVHSMCCRLHDKAPDTCLPNGLCHSDKDSQHEGLWRDFCTDSTWESPNCLPRDICTGDLNGSSNGTAPLQRCPHGNKDTSYCCGTDPSCCDGEKTFSLQPTLVPIGASSTVTTTATATVTATNTRTPGDGSSGSSSTKVAIGAGVGVPLGVVAMAMLGAGFWWGRRKTDAKYSRRLQDGTGVQLRGDAGHIPHKTQPVGSNPVYEVSGDATKQHVELPTVTTGGG